MGTPLHSLGFTLLGIRPATSDQFAGPLPYRFRRVDLVPSSTPYLHGCESGLLRQTPNMSDTAWDGDCHAEAHGFRAGHADRTIVRPGNRRRSRIDAEPKGI
jgi:hypothetical protein